MSAASANKQEIMCLLLTEEHLCVSETSAKAGLNIKALFRQLAQQLPGVDSGAPASAGESDTVHIKLDAPAPSAAATGACSC